MMVAPRVDTSHEQERPPVPVEVGAPHDDERGGIVRERPAHDDDAVHEGPRHAEPDYDAHARLRYRGRGTECERQPDRPDHVFHRSPPWRGLPLERPCHGWSHRANTNCSREWGLAARGRAARPEGPLP